MIDVGRFLVSLVHVDDGAAIGDHKALESPCVAEVLFQQHLAGAGGPPIDGVVGAHDGLHLALDDGGAERREIGFFEVARTGINIEAMTHLLRATVNRKMLAGGSRREEDSDLRPVRRR